MKRIVNGLLYDSEQATEIFRTSFIGPNTKPQIWYRTRNNRYFAVTKYDNLILLTIEDVKGDIGGLSVEAYIKEFGEPEGA